jgi:hypothetical protein
MHPPTADQAKVEAVSRESAGVVGSQDIVNKTALKAR